MNYAELIERVEKATGRDEAEELAPAILDALGFQRSEILCPTLDMYGNQIKSTRWSGVEKSNVTTSLDAALALVEAKLPGQSYYLSFIEMDDGPDWEAEVWGPGKRASRSHSKATPALALLAALLRALIAQEPTNV